MSKKYFLAESRRISPKRQKLRVLPRSRYLMNVNTDLLTAEELAEKLGGKMTAKRVLRWPTVYKDFPAYRCPGGFRFAYGEVINWMKGRHGGKGGAAK
jgi:hypothetical protein